jgi:formylglycine-generating enzyme required for sulfatase activity
LLAQYGWSLQNSKDRTWQGGKKKPNDLGLFDMHGNVWNWCQESLKDYPSPKAPDASEDTEDMLAIDSTASRVLRGGSFIFLPGNIRSAFRFTFVPSLRDTTVGFRPARTIAP